MHDIGISVEHRHVVLLISYWNHSTETLFPLRLSRGVHLINKSWQHMSHVALLGLGIFFFSNGVCPTNKESLCDYLIRQRNVYGI